MTSTTSLITRRRVLGAAAVTLAAQLAPRAWSQQAGGAVRVCVGFPPGSTADVVARVLAARLAAMGQPHIVENRPGAGGRLAVDNIKQARADGSALLVTPDAMMTLYPKVYRRLSYDPVLDFTPVTTLATVPLCISIGPLVPGEVSTLAEFVRWAAANPQKASFGTSGAGTTLHFTGWGLAQAARIELTHVPYRGSILALQDMVAGQIAASVNPLGEVLPFAAEGRARILAVSSAARSPYAASVPTVREAGFAALESMTWFGLFLPGKTPDSVVRPLQLAAAQAVNSAEAREVLSKMALTPAVLRPEEFKALIQADQEHWAPIVKQTGYVMEE
jgi:tripartite-type tricarboxylate transporter receptor subunit TctC